MPRKNPAAHPNQNQENKMKYTVETKSTPGAAMTIQSRHATLAEARTAARAYAHRGDLTRQDVRIDSADDGHLVEYAGPRR